MTWLFVPQNESPMRGKFGGKIRIFDSLGAVFPHFCPNKGEIWHRYLYAKFHFYRSNVLPPWGEKPICGPLSKCNTPLRTDYHVISIFPQIWEFSHSFSIFLSAGRPVKKPHFSSTRRYVTHDTQESCHGDRGGPSHFCNVLTFRIQSVVLPPGAIENDADDQYFSKLECSLSSDMARMSHFCRQWRLKPSASKTISSVFHLHNTSAITRELSVYLDGQHLRHKCYPTYLGVALDHTLSYREHLTKTASKLKNRNNLLMKLAGSTWGASANTLRSSALALCYSAAEYCASVWSGSAHTSQVDVQLNSTMHLISGTLRSTPLLWLPVLSNIEPPAL